MLVCGSGKEFLGVGVWIQNVEVRVGVFQLLKQGFIVRMKDRTEMMEQR